VLHFLTPAKVVLIQGDNNKNYSLWNSIVIHCCLLYLSSNICFICWQTCSY